jgi:serine/threonine protein kinase
VIPTTSGPFVSLAPLSIAGEFAGRYTVERELGRGATSVVWLARDREHGRMVAIKVLREELAAGVTADRFLREVRVTAQLQHPHIVPVLESGESDGRLFSVLPYLDGGTLRSRLERDKQLPVSDVIAIGTAIASALAAAHEKNVLHRDVKPENILFTGGQACLADFGIARAIVQASGDSTTSTGIVRGTPAYMSPEQAGGNRDYDGRSDIYSLACVLYEALAGVPAFVGATPAQVVAQRLVHPPRSVRVYRSTVSPELEAVLEKALAVAPADRYQSAKDFADALHDAPVASTRDSRPPIIRGSRRTAGLATVAAIASIAALVYLAGHPDRLALRPADILDTNRVAVLPFDGIATSPDDIPPGDMLLEALERWSNLSLVEDFAVADVVRRHKPIESTSDARGIARELRAGRFIRGRLIGGGAAQILDVVAYDTRTAEPVSHARMRVPPDSHARATFYRAVADSLVLRGAPVDSDQGSLIGFTDVAAAQLFLRGRARLRNWDLVGAESLFAAASAHEGTSPRALLWLAQVRAWRTQVEPDPATWRAAAERAMRDTSRLPRTERSAAIALFQLASGQYTDACRSYDGILARDSSSFVGWYGRAQCHDFDRVVVADDHSPTGWRFRTQQQLAIAAYQRAFQLLPSVYEGLADGSYAPVRQKLFTSLRYLHTGYSADSTHRAFTSRPMLRGDSIVFVPVPLDNGAAGFGDSDLRAARAAVLRQRDAFHRLTAGWAAALPNAVGPREALAISLELLGDPAAIDSFGSASRLATDSTQRLRLAVAAITMRVKVAFPDRVGDLRLARQQAESILATHRVEGHEQAELMSRLAVLTGHCGSAGEFARAGARSDLRRVFVPDPVAADIQERLAYIALGCPIPSRVPTLEQLDAQLRDMQPSDAARSLVLPFVLSRLVSASFPPDTTWLRRTTTPLSTVSRAEAAWFRGDSARARALLDRFSRTTQSTLPGDLTPDVALTEARLRLAMGDTVGARLTLDRTLSEARYYAPMSNYEREGNALIIGSLIRAAALRAKVTEAREARRWKSAIDELWSHADQALRSE